eukprot:jgi/Mesen1/9774/ME000007S09825
MDGLRAADEEEQQQEQHLLFDELTRLGQSGESSEGAGEGRGDEQRSQQQCQRGWCYMLGLGGAPVDAKSAHLWFARAAKQGHSMAATLESWTGERSPPPPPTTTTTTIMMGYGRAEGPFDALASWLRGRAACGDAICEAWVPRGHMWRKLRPRENPLPPLEVAARRPGGGFALYLLGRCYLAGLCVKQPDEPKGLRHMRKAALAGFAEVQAWLGWHYYRGNGGLRRSGGEAQGWFGAAAAQGLAEGQYDLAVLLYESQLSTRQRLRVSSASSQMALEILCLLQEAAAQEYAHARALLEKEPRLFGSGGPGLRIMLAAAALLVTLVFIAMHNKKKWL